MIPFVAMTGGLACGKSTVSGILEGLGVTVIDTDAVSRWLTGVNGKANVTVRKVFGDSVMNPDGSLNRERMRGLVFTDPASLKRLEDILHPLVKEETLSRMRKAEGDYGVLVVPLLFETGYYLEHTFSTLTIEAPADAQLERIIRKGWSEQEAQGAIRRQMTSDLRRKQADMVIENDSTIERLREQVGGLDRKFRELFRESR